MEQVLTDCSSKKANLGDLEIPIDKYTYFINEMVLSLKEKQQRLIIERYINNDGDTYDYIVASKIGLSNRTYYRLKLSTLLELGKKLGLEVYE